MRYATEGMTIKLVFRHAIKCLLMASSSKPARNLRAFKKSGVKRSPRMAKPISNKPQNVFPYHRDIHPTKRKVISAKFFVRDCQKLRRAKRVAKEGVAVVFRSGEEVGSSDIMHESIGDVRFSWKYCRFDLELVLSSSLCSLPLRHTQNISVMYVDILRLANAFSPVRARLRHGKHHAEDPCACCEEN